jgi:hypothetical protein
MAIKINYSILVRKGDAVVILLRSLHKSGATLFLFLGGAPRVISKSIQSTFNMNLERRVLRRTDLS